MKCVNRSHTQLFYSPFFQDYPGEPVPEEIFWTLWCKGRYQRQTHLHELNNNKRKTKMWANAQRDGRPAEYRWRPVQRRKVWLTPTTRVPCSNAAKTRNPVKFARVLQTRQRILAASRPKFTILWEHVEEILLLKKFFPIVGTCLSCEDIA